MCAYVLLPLILLLVLLLPGRAPALPGDASGADVVAGNIGFSRPDAAALQIHQHTPRAVINWSSFDIAAGERVQFLQPPGGATLNRISGGSPSQILGSLSATQGTLMLVNPDGIFFGPGAQVDVAGLVATSANLRDSDFYVSTLAFNAPGKPHAAVENQGTIRVADGGFATLVAPVVRNRGSITARLGQVHLGSGDVFTVDPYGDGLIQLAFADGPPTTAQTDLTAGSAVVADGGRIQLQAAGSSNLLRGVVNLDGTVQANRAELRDGRVSLAADTLNLGGTLAAPQLQGQARQVNVRSTTQPLPQAPGGTLQLAEGTYTLLAPLQLTAPLTLKGQGMDPAGQSGTALDATRLTDAGMLVLTDGVVLQDFSLYGGGVRGLATRVRMEAFPGFPLQEPPATPNIPVLPDLTAGIIPTAFRVSLLKNNLAAVPDAFGLIEPAAGDDARALPGQGNLLLPRQTQPAGALPILQSFLASGVLSDTSEAARETLLGSALQE